MFFTLIDHCDIAAHRSWADRRTSPAYVRGIPSWVWRSAMSRPGRPRPTATR